MNEEISLVKTFDCRIVGVFGRFEVLLEEWWSMRQIGESFCSGSCLVRFCAKWELI